MSGSTLTTPFDHRHDASIDDVLDFVNTLEFSSHGSRDDLPDAAALLAWLREHGLIHDEAEAAAAERIARVQPAGELLLEGARRFRTALRQVLEALDDHVAAPQPALDEINEVLHHSYTYELVPSADGAALGHRHSPDDSRGALASLAAALIDAIGDGRPDRLKVCENDQCRWVFRDASPAGRRRWCDMASCGNRAKARRHRQRVRSGAREAEQRVADA